MRNRNSLRLAQGGRACSRVQSGLGGVVVTSKVLRVGQVAAREAVLLV